VPGLATLELLRDVIVSFGIQETKMTAFLSFINRLSPVGNGWYVFYFMLGGMLWHKMDRIKEYRARLSLLGGLSWIVAFAIGYEISRRNGTTYNPAFNYGSIFMIAFVVGMFAFTLPFQKNCLWKRLLASVGQNTFGMYFTHFLFIFVLSRFWDYSEGYPRLLAYGIVVVGSYLLTLVMQKIPYVRQLIAL
jgi:surface polysaccharide O-acyltransferase-like enzyme